MHCHDLSLPLEQWLLEHWNLAPIPRKMEDVLRLFVPSRKRHIWIHFPRTITGMLLHRCAVGIGSLFGNHIPEVLQVRALLTP